MNSFTSAYPLKRLVKIDEGDIGTLYSPRAGFQRRIKQSEHTIGNLRGLCCIGYDMIAVGWCRLLAARYCRYLSFSLLHWLCNRVLGQRLDGLRCGDKLGWRMHWS